METKYTDREDGEVFSIPWRNWKFKCCDCGLVHVADFSILDGQLVMKVWRDEHETKKARESEKALSKTRKPRRSSRNRSRKLSKRPRRKRDRNR